MLSTAVKVPTLALIRDVAREARGDDGRAIVAGAVATALGLSAAIPPLLGNPIRKLGAPGMFAAASMTLLVAVGATWAAMRGGKQETEAPEKSEPGSPLNVILVVAVGGLATLGFRLATMVMAGARLGAGLPADAVALVLGGIGVFGALAGVPAGWIARRAGPALPLMLGAGLGVIGSLALTLPPGWTSGLIVAASFGIGGSCYVAGALTAVLSQAGTRHSGAAVGVLLAAESLAAAVQIAAAPHLAPRIGAQPAWVLLATAALAIALLPAGLLALRLAGARREPGAPYCGPKVHTPKAVPGSG